MRWWSGGVGDVDSLDGVGWAEEDGAAIGVDGCLKVVKVRQSSEVFS